MTPDEFDQFRRDAIGWRTKFAGNDAITERVNLALGLFPASMNPVSPQHKAAADARLAMLMPELYAEIAKHLGHHQ